VNRPAALLALSYVHQVTAAGGIPVLLPPVPGIAGALDSLDALVLSGGADLDPASYGAPRHPATGPLMPGRDAAEFPLLAGAVNRGLPVLAICRGLQLVNAARGGTLHQHLPDLVGNDSHEGRPGRFGRHEVRVDPRSRLGRLLGPPGSRGELRLDVPTSHHQAIDRLGPGLVATAWAADGTIEAIEPSDGDGFLIAVQWHPEAGTDPRLFRALIHFAQERATRKPTPAEPLDSPA
jgi:gamma-glutamyl-gamma-aminobutyrate hydrolase PuuD